MTLRPEAVFLDRAADLRYQVYAQLARQAVCGVTVRDLAVKLHWRYQATYYVVDEILMDLEQLLGRRRPHLRAQLLAADPLPVPLAVYRSYLAQRSLVYQLVDAAIQNPGMAAEAFAKRHFISRSTLNRRLRGCNTWLAQYQLKLRGSRLCFVGAELNVCYFIYDFYWWAHRGTAWPLAAVDQAAVAQQVRALPHCPQSPVGQVQMQLFLAAIKLRAGQRHPPASNPALQALATQLETKAMGRLSKAAVACCELLALTQYQFGQAAVADASLSANVPKTVTAQLLAAVGGQVHPQLAANLLRLVYATWAFAGVPRWAQAPVNVIGTEAMFAALDELPATPAYALFHTHQAALANAAAVLADSRTLVGCAHRQVRVEVAVALDSPGAWQLREFLQVLPGVCQLVPVGSGGDLVITDHQVASPTLRHHPQRQFDWYADALALPAYRQALLTRIKLLRKRSR